MTPSHLYQISNNSIKYVIVYNLIFIDINTIETIFTLKSKISSIIDIEPSRLNIYKYSGAF